MGDHFTAAHLRARRILCPLSPAIVAMAAILMVTVGATASRAQQVGQDYQVIPLGNGFPDAPCVDGGSNLTIESTPGGDDEPINGTNGEITTGNNGICETTLSGDDIYLPGFTLGGGRPFEIVIFAGDTMAGPSNGICDKITVAGGDDVVLAAAGKSTPRQVGIGRGPNNVINSTPAGDDVTTAVICAGSNSTIDSVAAGDDLSVTNDSRCNDAGCGSLSCIIPGVNDVLQTALAGDDITRPYVSTGADGILNTTATPDDQMLSAYLAVGAGRTGAACVDSGTNGIAETDLCGTGGIVDLGEACDTAGESATCDDDCTDVQCGDGNTNGAAGEDCDTGAPVNTPACDSDCTFVSCGDGHTNSTVGEECDDGGIASNDGCDGLCQLEYCGDGIVQSGLGETCDPGMLSPVCDEDCTAVACGDGEVNFLAGEECDDNNVVSNDGCDALCQDEFCGDGIIQSGIGEQCDNAGLNSDTTPDACRTNCALPSCGDSVVDPSNSEQCDDGNTKNNDDCLVALGCLDAVCGDAFKHTKGTPPFEECDDGNVANNDGCDSTCELEPTPGCGNGTVDTLCTAGTIGAVCAVNADCDVTLGDGVCTSEECDDGNSSNKDDCLNNCVDSSCGDGIVKNRGTPPFEECDDGNTQAGDGCSAICVNECGNSILDGACSQGTIGAYCLTNTDCDVTIGDGVCVTEECDTGIDGLCSATPPTCSDQCTLASCGNGVVECEEQCDLAGLNGVPGSGCTATCGRNVIGKKELTGSGECAAAWTLDNPPQDTKYHNQRCKDGAACDFDAAVNGECQFSVGVCLNRPLPLNCDQAPIIAVDLLGLKTQLVSQGLVAATLTDAMALMTSETAEIPGRCSSQGLKRKNCSINSDCDTFLGAHDGICDDATGVAYVGPLAAPPDLSPNQTTACSPGQPIFVAAGENLRLKLFARRDPSVRSDKDTMRLICEP